MTDLFFLVVLVGAGAGAWVATAPTQPASPMAPRRTVSRARAPAPGPQPALSRLSPEAESAPEEAAMEAPTATCPLFDDGGPSRPAAVNVSSSWLDGASGHARGEQEQRRLAAPMLVYFFTDWCGYCKEFEREILGDPGVEGYLRSRFVKVKLNPEEGPEERGVADRFGVKGYPSFFLVFPGATPSKKSTHQPEGGGWHMGSRDEFVAGLRRDVARRAQEQLAAGRQSRESGDAAGAVAMLDEAIVLGPEDAQAYYERALSHHESGEASRAIEDFRSALALQPRYPEVYRYLGRTLADRGHWDEMVGCWTKLIEQDPASATAFLERARGHEARRDRIRARADAQEACRLGERRACDLAARI